MKLLQLLEIMSLPAYEYSGGKDSLRRLADFGKREKRIDLPGHEGLTYSVEGDLTTRFLKLYLWDTKRAENQPIGKLTLERYHAFPKNNAFRVGVATVDEDYRKQKLAKALYNIALKVVGVFLVSGDSQTPGGKRNWVSLYDIPGVEVGGWLAIDDLDLSDKAIDTINGALGGIYLGSYNSGEIHYFAFEVNTHDTGKQLMSAVMTRLNHVYSKTENDNVGLYAKWVG